jgi:hypothetical protein
MLEQFHDVEEIAGVLSIQSGNELSSVNVFGCENRNLNVEVDSGDAAYTR